MERPEVASHDVGCLGISAHPRQTGTLAWGHRRGLGGVVPRGRAWHDGDYVRNDRIVAHHSAFSRCGPVERQGHIGPLVASPRVESSARPPHFVCRGPSHADSSHRRSVGPDPSPADFSAQMERSHGFCAPHPPPSSRLASARHRIVPHVVARWRARVQPTRRGLVGVGSSGRDLDKLWAQ